MGDKEPESNHVLQLGWLVQEETAERGLTMIRKWADRNAADDKACSEADTLPWIEAVLRGLGWDTLSGDVAREGTPKLGDIHLYQDGDSDDRRKVCAMIEVERLPARGSDLRKAASDQLENLYLRTLLYPDAAKLSEKERAWVLKSRLRGGDSVFCIPVLTNLRHWWIYAETYPLTGECRLGRPQEIDLSTSSAEALRSALGKDALLGRGEKFIGR